MRHVTESSFSQGKTGITSRNISSKTTHKFRLMKSVSTWEAACRGQRPQMGISVGPRYEWPTFLETLRTPAPCMAPTGQGMLSLGSLYSVRTSGSLRPVPAQLYNICPQHMHILIPRTHQSAPRGTPQVSGRISWLTRVGSALYSQSPCRRQAAGPKLLLHRRKPEAKTGELWLWANTCGWLLEARKGEKWIFPWRCQWKRRL